MRQRRASPEVYVSDKKILAICLSVSPPVAIEAIWFKNKLTMNTPIPLQPNRTALEASVTKMLQEYEERGFEVLVEEATIFASARGARRIRLGTNDETGKPLLLTALNIYRELKMQSAINLPKGQPGYELPDSIFDADKDARGNNIYHVDWANLRPTHVLTMLCCYATQFHNPDSSYFLSRMFSDIDDAVPSDRYAPLKSIIQHALTDETEMSVSPLTGQGNYL